MAGNVKAKKPPFHEFEAEFIALLGKRNASLNLRWVFRQNLALSHPPGCREHMIYFQTFKPETTRERLIAFYGKYADTMDFIGAEVLISEQSYTLCALLFDPWNLQDDEGDVLHEAQGYGFAVSDGYRHYREVFSRGEWLRKYWLQSRNLSGLDFVPRYRP